MTCILTCSGDLGSGDNTLRWLIWLLSWIPFLSPAQIFEMHYYLRKTGHVLTYAILYLLWFRAFKEHFHYGLKKTILWALALSLGLALADEGHQSLVASRSGSPWDVALDMSGVSLAALMSATLWPCRRPRPAPPGDPAPVRRPGQ
jgi:VanZ family protein